MWLYKTLDIILRLQRHVIIIFQRFMNVYNSFWNILSSPLCFKLKFPQNCVYESTNESENVQMKMESHKDKHNFDTLIWHETAQC